MQKNLQQTFQRYIEYGACIEHCLLMQLKEQMLVLSNNYKLTVLVLKQQSQEIRLFSVLGFSHKIDFVLPKDVTMDVDKTGQNLTVKSYDKELVGHVCSQIKALRPPEPYKGTGIKLAAEVLDVKLVKLKLHNHQ